MVKNIPITQDQDTLEGQTQQFVPNSVFPEQQQRVADPVVPEVPTSPSTVISDTPAPAPLSKTDEILKRMYATREKPPELDVEKQDRLRRMGKLNSIGKGVGLLSDALTLGMGGNVKRRGPDNISPALYQGFQNTLDKYKDQQDQYSLRDVANQRNNLRLELSDQYKKDADELNREKMAIQAKIAAAKDATEREKFKALREENANKLKELAEYHKGMVGSSWARAAAALKNKEGKDKQPITINSSSGVTYNLTPEEAQRKRDFSLKDEQRLLDRYPAWVTYQPKLDKNGDPTKEMVRKIDPRIKDDQLIRAQLDFEERQKGDSEAYFKNAGYTHNDGSWVPPATPVATLPIPVHAHQPMGTVTGPPVGSHAPAPQVTPAAQPKVKKPPLNYSALPL